MKNSIIEINKLKDEREVITSKIIEESKKILSKQTIVKIGDLVSCNGRSYTGKIIIVDDIYFTERYLKNRIEAVGYVLRKDNTKSVFRGVRVYDLDDPEAEEIK